MLGTTALLLVGPHAAARTSSGGWQFTLAPHAVAAAMDGAITIKGIEADVAVPLETIGAAGSDR